MNYRVILQVIGLVTLLCTCLPSFADIIVWTNGNGTGLWSDPANWQGNVVPGPSDEAQFDSLYQDDCLIDVDIEILHFYMKDEYFGTVTQGATSVITTNEHFVQVDGTFVGADTARINVGGIFALVNGTCTSTGGLLNLANTSSTTYYPFVFIGGTFHHNQGKVLIDYTFNGCSQLTCGIYSLIELELWDMEIDAIQNCSKSPLVSFYGNDSIEIYNQFTHTNGEIAGNWLIEGDLTVGASADGGKGKLIFKNNSTQLYSHSGNGHTGHLLVAKSDSALQADAGITSLGAQYFEIQSGTFEAPTGLFEVGGQYSANSTLLNFNGGTYNHNNGKVRVHSNIYSCSNRTHDLLNAANHQLYDLEIAGVQNCSKSTSFDTNSDTLLVDNDFTLTNGKWTGYMNVLGDLITGNSADGGLGEIHLKSTSDQYYTAPSTTPLMPFVFIDKPSGSILPSGGTLHWAMQGLRIFHGTLLAPESELRIGGTLSSSTTIFQQTGGQYQHNNGLINFDTHMYSCSQRNATIDLLVNNDFYDVKMSTSHHCSKLGRIYNATGDTLIALNDFIHESGQLNGTYEVRQDLSIGTSAQGGYGTIILNSTTNQEYSAASPHKRTCVVAVDKSTGTVTPTLSSTEFYVQGLWVNQGSFTAPSGTLKIGGDFPSGNFDVFKHQGGTLLHNNGTVEFDPKGLTCSQSKFYISAKDDTRLYDIDINTTHLCGKRPWLLVNTNDTLIAENDIRHLEGYISGIFATQNDLYIADAADAGLGTILFTGDDPQQYYEAESGSARTAKVGVLKNSGIVLPKAGTDTLCTQGLILSKGDFKAPAKELNIGGDYGSAQTIFSHSQGTFLHNNGNVKLQPKNTTCSSFDYKIDVAAHTEFYNLEFNGSSPCGITSSFMPGNGDSIAVINQLSCINGRLKQESFEATQDVVIGADWDASPGTLLFTGSNSQNFDLSGATDKWEGDIEINKSGGKVTLLSDLYMDDAGKNLNLVSGQLVSSDLAMLIIGDNVQVTGGNDSAYVVGPMRKIGNEAFTFHVGQDTTYAPIGISAPASGTDHFTARYIQDDPDTLYSHASKHVSINNLSKCEYWILDRTNGTSAVNVTLSWADRSCGVTEPSTLLVSRWDGSMWQNHGNGAWTGNDTAGTLTSSAPITNFSPFALGSGSGGNALPVTLLDFEAHYNNSMQAVVLDWSTVAEINNKHFELERSLDGQHWQQFDQVAGQGTSTTLHSYRRIDHAPLQGNNYYRLKQVDFDGQFDYSDIAAVHVDMVFSPQVQIFPNPSSGVLHIQGPSAALSHWSMWSAYGQKVTDKVSLIEQSEGQLSIDISALENGMYILKTGNSAHQIIKH